MTNQPGFPVAPGAGLAAMAMSQGDDPELPSDEESPTADWPAQEDEDNGVPVGAADAEEDRRRAADDAEPNE